MRQSMLLINWPKTNTHCLIFVAKQAYNYTVKMSTDIHCMGSPKSEYQSRITKLSKSHKTCFRFVRRGYAVKYN